MNEKAQEVLRVAREMYNQQPDWVTFFREVLGVSGVVRTAYPTAEAMADFEQTSHGPRLVDAGDWALVERESAVDVGWSTLYTCRIVEVHVGDGDDALVHRRGRYRRATRADGPSEQ